MSWTTALLRKVRPAGAPEQIIVSSAPPPSFAGALQGTYGDTAEYLDGERRWDAADEATLDEAMDLPRARCESRKREGSRSWRCTKDAGHEKPPMRRTWMDEWHGNGAAGRRWA